MNSRHVKSFALAAATIVLLLLYFFVDARKGGFPTCPFHKLTGLLCPGCGSQRGLSALLHGDVLEAFQFNPLLVCAVPLVVYAVVIFVKTNGTQRPKLLYHPLFAKLCLWVVLLFWIGRNLVVHI